MKTKNLLTIAMAAFVAINFTGCKEEEPAPSNIPTVPTQFSIEDGAIITDTIIQFSASGSTVENTNIEVVNYRYYYGQSTDEMIECNGKNVILKPYTQYYWYAKAYSKEHYYSENTYESEQSEIFTFYCVPPLGKIETDNGEGDWAAVIRFKELKDIIKKGKVTVSPDKQGYPYQKEHELAEGQDSCYIQMGNANSPVNAAYTHWWDDDNNVFYEPIIYEFEVSLDLQVGDKVFTVTNKAKEIILDKSTFCHDHEFNVYRLVRIGNQVWLAEDFRAKSIIYNDKVYALDTVGLHSTTIVINEDYTRDTIRRFTPVIDNESFITLPSGAQGIVYNLPLTKVKVSLDNSNEVLGYDLIMYAVPQGFHIPTIDDWYELERFYNVNNPSFKETSGPERFMMELWYDYYMARNLYLRCFDGVDSDVRNQMMLMNQDWIFHNEEERPEPYLSLFNARPFAGEGYGCIYWVRDMDANGRGSRSSFVVLSSFTNGIGNITCSNIVYQQECSIRLIKD